MDPEANPNLTLGYSEEYVADLRRVNRLLVRALRNCGEVANDETAGQGARLHQIAVYCRDALAEAENLP